MDNMDWDVKVHEMRSDNQNKSVHAVATSLVFDRVFSEHPPDDKPQQSLASCGVTTLMNQIGRVYFRYTEAYSSIMCIN